MICKICSEEMKEIDDGVYECPQCHNITDMTEELYESESGF